jgi:glycosyltransferase involved in cell wall biosynthesis
VNTTRRLRLGIEVNARIVGGTEHFLANLLAFLDTERFEPVVISSESGPTHDLFRTRNVDVAVVPYTSAAMSPPLVADFLRTNRIDVVQSSYFSPLLGLAAVQAGVPHVWRFGGHIAVVHEGQSRHDKQVFLALATFLSRRVVCGSKFLRGQFELIRHEGVEVIYNGLDPEAFDSAPKRLDPQRPHFAMLAHLVPQKRHEDFIRAAALVRRSVPASRFDLFGREYPSDDSRLYAERLRALVAEMGLTDTVRFIQLDGGRAATLRDVDVFVLPAVNEGASNAILEAMALGKPVIAADSGGNPELVSDGVTGYLMPPESPDTLAARMLSLIRSPETAHQMGVAARCRVEQEFDIRTCARNFESLYRAVSGMA